MKPEKSFGKKNGKTGEAPRRIAIYEHITIVTSVMQVFFLTDLFNYLKILLPLQLQYQI